MQFRRRRKKRFLKRGAQKEDMALQITAMADIFTVLLVFLIKTFSTGISSITPNPAIHLPEATWKDKVVDALKVEIAPGFIALDGKTITSLAEFRFQESDVESDGTPRSLNTALIRERAKKPIGKKKPKTNPAVTTEANAESEEDNATKLLVLADEKTPYRTLKSVLDAAAGHGFADFKLVVVGSQ